MKNVPCFFHKKLFKLTHSNGEVRFYKLKVVEFILFGPDQERFEYFLYDYYGWPITDWNLISQAVVKFLKVFQIEENKSLRE